jgi:hypothetical protein
MPEEKTGYSRNPDFGEVTTDELFDTGDILVYGAGNSLVETVEPSGSTTPVQDAVDLLESGGGTGTVLLPVGIVTESGRIDNLRDKCIIGRGLSASTLEITDLGADGIRFDGDTRTYLHNFTLSGSDKSNRTGGSALHWVNTNVRMNNIGLLQFTDWIDPVIHLDTGNTFSSEWGMLYNNSDGRFIRDEVGALLLTIHNIYSAGSTQSAVYSLENNVGGTTFIGELNAAGDHNSAIQAIGSTQNALSVRAINFEPKTDPSGGNAVNIQAGQNVDIETLRVVGSINLDNGVIVQNYNGEVQVGEIITVGGPTFNNSKIRVAGGGAFDTAGHVRYGGGRDDMTDNFENGEKFWSEKNRQYQDPAAQNSPTLSGGSTPAARVDGYVGNQSPRPSLQKEEIDSAPATDFAFSRRWEWDESAGSWDLVYEWDTDPGAGNDVVLITEAVRTLPE